MIYWIPARTAVKKKQPGTQLNLIFLQNNPVFFLIQIFDCQSDQTFWITLHFLAQVPEAPERCGGIRLIQDMNVLILHFRG